MEKKTTTQMISLLIKLGILLIFLLISKIGVSQEGPAKKINGILLSVSDLYHEVKFISDSSNIDYVFLGDYMNQTFLFFPDDSKIFSDSIVFNKIRDVYLINIHHKLGEAIFDSTSNPAEVLYKRNYDGSVNFIFTATASIHLPSEQRVESGYYLYYYGIKYKINFYPIPLEDITVKPR